MNKKLIAVVVVSALAFVLAGCAASSNSSSQQASSAASSEPQTGMANPWQDVASADEAAKGAGIDGFAVVEGARLSLGAIEPWTYRCMDGIAEADSYVGASKLCVRKGTAPDGSDIAGDYNEYPAQWTQNIKGLEVTCYGPSEEAAHKILWSANGYDYSILVIDQDDPQNFPGITADDVASLVNGIQ